MPKTITDNLPLSLGEECELTVDRLGYGGMGIARHASGFVCLVAKALPNERIKGKVVQLKKRHAVLELIEVLAPSKLRVEAPCHLFKQCGGCHLQMLPYPEQLAAKQQVLQEHFDRLPSTPGFKCEAVQAAEPNLRYRNKNFFHIDKGRMGFIDPLHHSLIPIPECPCAADATNKTLPVLQDWLAKKPLELQQALLDCLIRESTTTHEMMMIVIVDIAIKKELLSHFDDLKKLFPTVSIFLNFKNAQSRQSFGETFTHLCGKQFMRETIGTFQLRLSPTSFVQIHPGQAASLYARAVSELSLQGTEHLLDLFSGSGALSLYLSRQAATVYSIEMNHLAVDDAVASAQLNGIHNVTFRAGRCERLLDKLIKQGQRFKVATLNPPRTGCPPELIPLLKKSGIEKFAYISCSPPTLQRDIQSLQAEGYQIKKAIPFDMFPQTYHLEVLTIFEKRA